MRNHLSSWWAFRLALTLCLSVLVSSSAATIVLRVAVGPFFAPVGNEQLRQASQILPELLMTELSHSSSFELVEREKANSVWSEYNLTASGLVSRDTVIKMGHILNCDWLLSGSIVEANGRTFVWTKIIDVRSGVVVDLHASPFEPGDFSKSTHAIAAYVEKADRQTQGRQFIAMGPFVDMNPALASKREDWSKRIPALIEKHFLNAGFGVVELAAIGPIFEERRLETAGLTGNPEGRVKLQAAFWLIDGGCEWNETAPNKLDVGLRIQKVGCPEQMLRLAGLAGDDLESAVINAIERAITNANSTAPPAPNAEADLLQARGMEHVTLRSPFQPKRAATRTQWDAHKLQRETLTHGLENRQSLIANYKRLLLRDPKNLEAKVWLAAALLGEPDPAKREYGKELLRDVVASGDPGHAGHAKFYLENAERIGKSSDQMTPAPKRPDDWLSVNQAFNENPNDPIAKCDLGAALLTLPRSSDQERGRKLLGEVIAMSQPEQAERARKLLAAPEKYPTVKDQIAVVPVAQAAALPTPALSLEPEQDDEREQREFLQENFAKFTPINFEKDGPDFAKFQRLLVKESRFSYQGQYYSGFRFTAPSWLDGNLWWTHTLAKTEGQKDFSTQDFSWYIIPKSGRMRGFQSFSRFSIASYTTLSKQFPYTLGGFEQTLPRSCLVPGQEYAIWFAYKNENLPDIAFALTIQSAEGRLRCGMLPLR